VIELEKGDAQSEAHTIRLLKEMQIRYLFCPHQSFRSAWMLRNVKAQKKVAYKRWWNFLFFDERVERPMTQPEVVRLMALLQPVSQIAGVSEFSNSSERNTVLNWGPQIPDELSMAVTVSANEIEKSLQRFQIRKPFAIIAPSSQWPTKRWATTGYKELSTMLLNDKLNIYVMGSPNEVADCHSVCKDVVAPSGFEIKNLAGQLDLFDLHRVMSAAQFVVANDSGAMHMAAASGVSVIGIFGPTVLNQGYRPWANSSVIVQKDLACRPCGKHGHIKCPLGTHDCMKKISASDVREAVNTVKSLTR
jgi:heptosyltransferase II